MRRKQNKITTLFVAATLLFLNFTHSPPGTYTPSHSLAHTKQSPETQQGEIQNTISESPKQPQSTPQIIQNQIVQKRLPITEERISFTKEYTQMHYGFEAAYMDEPKMIVIHWTGGGTAQSNYNYFSPARLSASDDWHLQNGANNVGAHFIVDRDGTIWQLFPETFIARHCIGMNYHAIGIENVGGYDGSEDLTDTQLAANIYLVRHLRAKYTSIDLVIGHHEYRQYENTEYFTELVDGYINTKPDPGVDFMRRLRDGL